MWGASTSAYQVEGGIEGNDWAAASADGRVPPAGLACDHWNKWREDFELAAALGHNAHRLSLEWSRIEPQPRQWDEAAIAHYHDVLSWLKDHRIKTFVTLHHFTNPTWVAAAGGWENRRTVAHFAEYVSKVCQALGHLVDFWITINEPGVCASQGYLESRFPPFKKNIFAAARVYRNLLSAHNAAYGVIHAYYPQARAGFAQNIASEAPRGGLRRWFLTGFSYRITKNDFAAVNHYFYRGPLKTPVSDRGWKIYPPAMSEVLMDLKRFRLPIYITENGLADARDEKRADYIREYLRAVWQAIRDGADVRGYLHWSLLDNYEWQDGFRWKFGLVAVDFSKPDLQRYIRPSARYYARICQDNAL